MMESGVQGGQAIERALHLLASAVGTDGGARLTDLARAHGLSKPTAHRILSTLVRMRFLDMDAASKRYRPGLELFRLGRIAAERYAVRELAAPSLAALAEATGDTVFLSVRDGTEAVCVDREIGAFPIRTLTLNVGDRRPLGVGSGSLALLAALHDEEIDAILAERAHDTRRYANFDARALWRLVQRTRRDGFALNDGGILPEMSGVAVAIIDGGEPVAAISVAAIASRLAPPRRKRIVTLLQREAKTIEKRLHERAQ